MAMNPTALRNLTLASAKHLVSQGHITPKHHAKIMKSVKATAPAAGSTGMSMADEAPGSFGSLNPRQGAGAGHYMATTGQDEGGY